LSGYWKNPAGFPLALFFLIGGIVFTITIPGIFIGQIWIVVSLFLIGLFVFLSRRAAAGERLKAEGIPGSAQILELEQTGVYINEQPQVKLRLRVEPRGRAPFETVKRVTVPMIALGTLTNGRPLKVVVDAENQDRVVIDWGGSGAAPAMLSHQGGAPINLNANPAARDAAMQALRDRGIDPSGNVDLRSNPAARAAVLAALKEHGLDVAHEQAAADPATDVPESKGEPLDRLTKLMQLRAANLITDAELAEHRKRIVEDV
jgi:hypothetical protein